MRLDHELIKLGDVPIGHGVLRSLLHGYRRPNDKISDWIARGILIPVKRGLYVVNPSDSGRLLCLPLIANQLYGPSYVSLDYALDHYGLIPEAVHEVTCVTSRRAKSYDTGLGRFTYAHLPPPAYPLGVRSVRNDAGRYFLMATPEKALCDRLIQTSNLSIHSPSAMRAYLEEDLRLDLEETIAFDHLLLRRIAAAGVKQRLLEILCRTLEHG